MIIAERNAKEKRTGQISADALAKFAILFLVCEVREIADIGIQQIECRFFLDGGQAFQPLANLVVGVTWDALGTRSHSNVSAEIFRAFRSLTMVARPGSFKPRSTMPI